MAGTGKRVAVVATGPLEDISSIDYVSTNSISVIGTFVLNRLGFSCEVNYQWIIGKFIFGKLMHDLVWITPAQLFDISFRGRNHVEEELARVRNLGVMWRQ